MAINYPQFQKLTAADMGGLGGFDLGQAIRSGFENYKGYHQAKYEPRRIENESQIEGAKANYAERLQQAMLQHQNALTEKANRGPELKLNNLEKAEQGYNRAVAQFGERSEQAERAKNYAMRLAQGSQGLQLTTDPATGALTSLSLGGSSRGGGQSMITTDENGNPILVSKPTTPTTTAQQKGSLANIIRQSMAKHIEQPYIGSGSNAQLLQDRILYNQTTNLLVKKQIGDRLVNAAVSMKLAPEYAGAQLNAQGIPATVPALKHQNEAITQGWAEALNKVVNNLPPELQAQAREAHDKAIEELNNERNQFIAQGLPIKLKQRNQGPPESALPKGAMVGMYKKGKFHLIPADKAKDAQENWGYKYEK